jgi:hypothetical protein
LPIGIRQLRLVDGRPRERSPEVCSHLH